jgi:hypothetical protein
MTFDPIQAQRAADARIADVKILQKVNAVHREVFGVKYPSQVEHCLRLTMERLQAGLDKRDGVDIARPDTWRMSTVEIEELAHTAYLLNEIRNKFNGA